MSANYAMTAPSPTVTIILPTHDRLPFLRIAVASVLAQTYRDWNLVIADDGSDDETRAFLTTLAAIDRVKVLWLPHTGNPARTRNAALREADGEFVAFMDSDDVWLPKKLDRQLRALREQPECKWCYTAFLRIDARGQPLDAERTRRWTPYAGDILAPLISTAASLRTPSVIADRSFVQQAEGFDETLRAAEDYDLWMRLALASPIALVDEQLVHVRVHAANQSDRSWPAAFIGRERSLRKLRTRAPKQYRKALRRARMKNASQLVRSYLRRHSHHPQRTPSPPPRMKIAMIVPGGVDRSGDRRVIPALLALLRRLAREHEVHVFCFSQEPEPGEWDLLGARIHNVGGLRRARLFRTVLREHSRAPFRLVHAIWSGPCGMVAVPIAKLLRIPSIVHVAGGELASLPQIDYGGALRWRGRVRERILLRRADLVTAATPFILESIERLGITARRVPLGVDLAVWPPLAPRRRDTQMPARLLHVASINRVKDQRTLLQALALLRDEGENFHLDFVGEDTLNGQMQALAATLGLADAITFHGFMTQREWRPLAEAAHVLLMSSLHEAGPLVVLEAAVVGVPTVGTAVGHIVEWAPSAALCVPPGDAVQLGRATQRLLHDEDLRLRIAQAAAERATREDADFTARSIAVEYERLLRRKASTSPQRATRGHSRA